MKRFSLFIEETTKTFTFAFGRFNPPTIGHLKLLDKVASIAAGGDYAIYASQTNDPKKNPLAYNAKIRYMKAMFPKHKSQIISDTDIKSALDVLKKVYESDKSYTQVNFVCGADRIKDFAFLKKYNGTRDESGKMAYNFPDGIKIVSAGERDPDSDDIVSAMSASRLRAAASEGNFKEFELGMPKGFTLTHELFNDIRKGMNLKPITNFREHIKLPSTSNIREQYIANKILSVDSKATNVKTNEVITVKERKTNYIIDANKKKHFITDLVPHA